jgi:hypothetical protein
VNPRLNLLDTGTATAPTISFEDDGAALQLLKPITVTRLGHEAEDYSYDSVDPRGSGELVGRAALRLEDGTELTVVDRFSHVDNQLSMHRQVHVETAGTAEGLRIGFSAQSEIEGANEGTWQYFIPSTMYNRNDTDGDGKEDYLGTYVQDHRDDKNGILGMLARDPGTGTTLSVARTSKPTFDTAVSPEQLQQKFFVQETDIGSLGLAPGTDGQVNLRASYPFSEEYSFCLDTAGSGWAAFAPNQEGLIADVSYEFRLTRTDDLTDAIWELFEHQRQVLGTTRPTPDVTLSESVEYRQLLTQLYYRKWEPAENEKEPAGYLVHFSPRTGETLGSLLEFGFSGDQTLLAYVQMKWGQDKNIPLYEDRAASVLDFFVNHCQLDNGFCHGIFDPINDKFTHWFTGILMPFQYATDENEVRRYVGSQIAEALMPIARELRSVEGNYLRTMCESVYPLLLAYETGRQSHESWLKAGVRFGEFLLSTQAEDGSWYRAYSPDGEGLTSPGAWFGASYTELKSGTIFPVPVLTTLHRLTGDHRYLVAAEKAADFIIDTFVDPVAYVGGLNDTTHIKSVKTDAVGIMFLMRSLLKAYEASNQPRFLQGAVKAAKVLSSWVYLWDVPMPEGTLLEQARFKSTGWAGCDAIASGTYLDNEFLEFTGDLANVAVHSGERSLLDVAELVQFGMQHALSTPTNDHGYVAPGIQCEGVLTSYWLSAPDTTEFSGAVNKVKGDDNDTCNALTNGQAAYGIYDLEKSFGTSDFNKIRESFTS